MTFEREFPLDFGDDHQGCWFVWAPDRDLNPQYADWPDMDPAGFSMRHRLNATEAATLNAMPHNASRQRNEGDWCEGAVTFEGVPGNGPRWTLESVEPLTVAPSILCECGHHGYVREGRWVNA